MLALEQNAKACHNIYIYTHCKGKLPSDPQKNTKVDICLIAYVYMYIYIYVFVNMPVFEVSFAQNGLHAILLGSRTATRLSVVRYGNVPPGWI